jgi:hypothetical protein
MGKFLEAEWDRQTQFKLTSSSISDKADGEYKKRPRPFCLLPERAVENLFPPIRRQAVDYFRTHDIHWHDGVAYEPSNHLCDSQVCCVNFLFPFADEPSALVTLLRPIFPRIRRVLPMEQEGQFLVFEWVGECNYLRERVPRNTCRKRGRHFTSADAAVLFENEDGSRQIALIEWKYTESYSAKPLIFSESGTDRRSIYAHLYDREGFPLRNELLPSFDALFYEPFYQLFRQQCLANEMERAREFGADEVSVLHVAPSCNLDLRRVTSPQLEHLGSDVMMVWRRLVRRANRFTSISTEELFGRFPIRQFAEMRGWWEYVTERYAWVARSDTIQ